MSDLLPLLAASVELIELRRKVESLQIDNANLRARLRLAEARLQSDFEMSGDNLPAMCRRQAE